MFPKTGVQGLTLNSGRASMEVLPFFQVSAGTGAGRSRIDTWPFCQVSAGTGAGNFTSAGAGQLLPCGCAVPHRQQSTIAAIMPSFSP